MFFCDSQSLPPFITITTLYDSCLVIYFDYKELIIFRLCHNNVRKKYKNIEKYQKENEMSRSRKKKKIQGCNQQRLFLFVQSPVFEIPLFNVKAFSCFSVPKVTLFQPFNNCKGHVRYRVPPTIKVFTNGFVQSFVSNIIKMLKHSLVKVFCFTNVLLITFFALDQIDAVEFFT